MGVYLDDLEFCNFSWSVLWMLTYFAILLGIDNGPCKHICNVVEGNVVCSCLSGYTIMADGISCEGKWLWFTTEMWLNHYYVDLTDCRPQGVFLRVLYFQYCALQMAVQRQNCCLWDLLAEGIAGLLYRWLLKHFYPVYLLPGWGQARFCAYFLWCPTLFFSPLSICSHCCFSQSLTVQLWTCSLSSWEWKQLAGPGHVCCLGEPSQSYRSAQWPVFCWWWVIILFLLPWKCEVSLVWRMCHCGWVQLHAFHLTLKFRPAPWQTANFEAEFMILHILYILNGHVWLVTKDIFAQQRLWGWEAMPCDIPLLEICRYGSSSQQWNANRSFWCSELLTSDPHPS